MLLMIITGNEVHNDILPSATAFDWLKSCFFWVTNVLQSIVYAAADDEDQLIKNHTFVEMHDDPA